MSFSSEQYWKNRYENGGDSGAGSRGFLAQYKGEFISEFIAENGIKELFEYGCGDGFQLRLICCEKKYAYDISEVARESCKELNPDVIISDFFDREPFELSLSLDVIYHLIEDEIFDEYMNELCASSGKYIIIYAPNATAEQLGFKPSQHVKPRFFIDHKALKPFELIGHYPNLFPSTNHEQGSFSEWWIFKRK